MILILCKQDRSIHVKILTEFAVRNFTDYIILFKLSYLLQLRNIDSHNFGELVSALNKEIVIVLIALDFIQGCSYHANCIESLFVLTI